MIEIRDAQASYNGQQPYSFTFYNAGAGVMWTKYNWGDGSEINKVVGPLPISHLYSQPGLYTIEATWKIPFKTEKKKTIVLSVTPIVQSVVASGTSPDGSTVTAASGSAMPAVITNLDVNMDKSWIGGAPFRVKVLNSDPLIQFTRLNFGDGSPEVVLSKNLQVEHTYQSAGLYEMVVAMDRQWPASNRTITRHITVTPSLDDDTNQVDANGTAHGAPTSFMGPAPYTLALVDTTPPPLALRTTYDWGDGQSISDVVPGTPVTHQYNEIGVYTVTIKTFMAHPLGLELIPDKVSNKVITVTPAYKPARFKDNMDYQLTKNAADVIGIRMHARVLKEFDGLAPGHLGNENNPTANNQYRVGFLIIDSTLIPPYVNLTQTMGPDGAINIQAIQTGGVNLTTHTPGVINKMITINTNANGENNTNQNYNAEFKYQWDTQGWFQFNIDHLGLQRGNTYSVRPYVENHSGVTYGATMEFSIPEKVRHVSYSPPVQYNVTLKVWDSRGNMGQKTKPVFIRKEIVEWRDDYPYISTNQTSGGDSNTGGTNYVPPTGSSAGNNASFDYNY